MPKSYADLLREARAQIREVTPQEVEALARRRRHRHRRPRGRPSGSRATCPAPPTSPRATSSSRSKAPSPIATRPVDPVLRRRRPVAVRGPDPRRDGLHERRLDVAAASRPGRAPGYEFETPVVLTAEQKQRYSRHLLIPEVGSAGQAKLLGSKALLIGAGGLGSPAALYLAAAGRRHDRHRRLRRRRRQQPPAPDHPHDRSGRGAQGRVGAQGRSTP